MLPHHAEAIEKFVSLYSAKPEYVAILLAGSIAHGYAKTGSDVDVILVATEDEYRMRQENNKLAFSIWDICNYEGGYIDCKVTSPAALELIAEKGSDPARYAFKDAQILSVRDSAAGPLASVLGSVTRFPKAKQTSRQHRFLCQVLAWKWYMSQAEEKNNLYLQHLSTQKLALFACRAILNFNQALYPFHKWMLEETKRAAQKPSGFLETIEELLARPSLAQAQKLADLLFAFLGLNEKDTDWPNQFMTDSEMNWLQHEAPVDDL